MIGKIYSSLFPYFDRMTNKMSYKNRPVLIISDKKNNDYTILPISKVSIKKNIDLEFDVQIIPENYPKLNLKNISYVRTHKQTPLHQGCLHKEISDLKESYPELFLEIISKVEEFNKRVVEKSLENL